MLEKLNRVHVLCQSDFDLLMKNHNFTDDNIEEQRNTAFISIIATKSCNEEYIIKKHGVDTKHWFKEKHSNVLNLEFDDIEEDLIFSNGVVYKTITTEQADKIIGFIDKNNNKDFLIHCYAGISRSGAVALFLNDFYDWIDKETFQLDYENRIHPNQKVYHELKMALDRFNGIENYKDIWNINN